MRTMMTNQAYDSRLAWRRLRKMVIRESTRDCAAMKDRTRIYVRSCSQTVWRDIRGRARDLRSCRVKLFADSGNLMTHTRTHTYEKPFSRNICYKSFTQKGNFKTRIRTRQKIDLVRHSRTVGFWRGTRGCRATVKNRIRVTFVQFRWQIVAVRLDAKERVNLRRSFVVAFVIIIICRECRRFCILI